MILTKKRSFKQKNFLFGLLQQNIQIQPLNWSVTYYLRELYIKYMITEEQLEKFRAIYLRNYKVQLDREEATKMAIDLVNLFKVLTKPLPKNETAQ